MTAYVIKERKRERIIRCSYLLWSIGMNSITALTSLSVSYHALLSSERLAIGLIKVITKDTEGQINCNNLVD